MLIEENPANDDTGKREEPEVSANHGAVGHGTHQDRPLERDEPIVPVPNRPNVAEWVAVLVTCVIAVVGILQYNIYRQQKKIMEASSSQTDQLIQAANVQAGAATKVADASDRNAKAAAAFALSADGINTRIIAAEKDFQRMADNAKQAVNVTVEQSRLEQRAWLGLYSPNPNTSPGGYGLQFNSFALLRNTGRTPAMDVSGIVITLERDWHAEIPDFDVEYAATMKGSPLSEDKRTPTILDASGIIAYITGNGGESVRWMLPEHSVIAPDAVSQVSLASESHKDEPLNKGTQILYMIGKVTYDDIFKARRHMTKFCYGYSHSSLYLCPKGNSMD